MPKSYILFSVWILQDVGLWVANKIRIIQEQHTGIEYNVLYDYHDKHSLCHWATAYKDVSSDINANGYHYYSLK